MPRSRPAESRLVLYRGTWAIEWWHEGVRRRTSTGTKDETKAKQILADFELEEPGADDDTLGHALDRYADARKGKVLAHDRLTQAVSALKDSMGALRLDQVDQARWDRYAANRKSRPRPSQKAHIPTAISPGTLRREFNVLRAAVRLAWKQGLLARPPSLEPPPDSAPRDRYLTKVEARALIDAAKTPHVKLFVALAIYTGARRGSILSLTWDRVNFTTGMIDFQEPDRQLTRKRRAITPIVSGLFPLLQEAKQMTTSEYVIEYNGKPVPTGLRWSFEKLCKAAGLTWRPTPHHFKHSVASWFAMDKVPIGQAADWLATDEKTLHRTYRKFDPSYLRSVTATFDI